MNEGSILSRYADEMTSAQYITDPAIARDNEIKNLSIEHERIDDSLILSWTIPFTESKSLHVSISIPYEITDKDKHYYRVLTWQTMPND